MLRVNLDKLIHEMGLTKNKLAVISTVRPNTVINIAEHKAVKMDYETIDKLLNGLNEIARERGIERRFGILDLLTYVDENEPVIEEKTYQDKLDLSEGTMKAAELTGDYERTKDGYIKVNMKNLDI